MIPIVESSSALAIHIVQGVEDRWVDGGCGGMCDT